uniref:Uncharacterized protein n=1 Tax=Strigamia maritima TaxID=126957 RepID=T1IKE5_STRMM
MGRESRDVNEFVLYDPANEQFPEVLWNNVHLGLSYLDISLPSHRRWYLIKIGQLDETGCGPQILYFARTYVRDRNVMLPALSYDLRNRFVLDSLIIKFHLFWGLKSHKEDNNSDSDSTIEMDQTELDWDLERTCKEESMYTDTATVLGLQEYSKFSDSSNLPKYVRPYTDRNSLDFLQNRAEPVKLVATITSDSQVASTSNSSTIISTLAEPPISFVATPKIFASKKAEKLYSFRKRKRDESRKKGRQIKTENRKKDGAIAAKQFFEDSKRNVRTIRNRELEIIEEQKNLLQAMLDKHYNSDEHTNIYLKWITEDTRLVKELILMNLKETRTIQLGRRRSHIDYNISYPHGKNWYKTRLEKAEIIQVEELFHKTIEIGLGEEVLISNLFTPTELQRFHLQALYSKAFTRFSWVHADTVDYYLSLLSNTFKHVIALPVHTGRLLAKRQYYDGKRSYFKKPDSSHSIILIPIDIDEHFRLIIIDKSRDVNDIGPSQYICNDCLKPKFKRTCPDLSLLRNAACQEADLNVDVNLGLPGNQLTTRTIQYVKQARKLVNQNLERMSEKSKKRFDKNRQQIDFSPGDFVYLRKPNRKVGLSEKLLPQYSGPWEIVMKTAPNNYQITNHSRKKMDIVNVERLK